MQVLDADDKIRSGGEARYQDVYRKLTESASIDVEGVDFGEAIRGLEQEGKIMVLGEGGGRRVRRVTGGV